MALKTDLMSASLPWEAAGRLGYDAPALTVTQAGSGQSSAYALVSNFNIVTAGTGGVLLPSIHGPVAVINNSGANCIVYPPVGSYINAGAVNAGLTIGNGKQALFEPAGLYWVGILSA